MIPDEKRIGGFRLAVLGLIFFPTTGCQPSSAVSQDAKVASRTKLSQEDTKNTIEVPDLRTRRFGDDWPGFLGPTGDGKSQETGILTDWPESAPRLVWHMRIGTSYGMPSIALGRLFMFHRFGDQARVTCMHSETGEHIWDYEYPTDYVDFYNYDNGPRCCPVIDADRVYVYGVEGLLTCLRVTDGSVVWQVDTVADFGVQQNFFGVGSAPVIEGDLLIVQVGGSPPDSPSVRSGAVKPNGTAVVAFDKYTGKVRYKTGNDLASYAGPVLATIENHRWCFLFARSGLLGFEPTTGEIDFHFPWQARIVESVNAANPVVVGKYVFISEAYDYDKGSCLLRVLPGNAEVVWRDEPRSREKAMQCHFATPIYADGYLYGSSARHSQDAELKCIEFLTGREMWSVPGMRWTSLLYADDHFVALSDDGTLRLIKANPAQFELVSRTRIRSDRPTASEPSLEAGTELIRYPAWAAPILSHGLLYVRGADRLVCLELIPAP